MLQHQTNNNTDKSDHSVGGTIKWMLLLLVVSGTFLRFQTYFAEMPVWGDTARLAVNVVYQGVSGLAGQLDWDQSAPIGFLLLSKLTGFVGDYTELALYLVPLLSGVGALVLFAMLCRRLFPGSVALIPVAMLAFNTTAIFYSGTFKQYSTDLLVTVIILYVTFRTVESRSTKLWVSLFTVTGIASVWFSLASVIILAAAGLALFVRSMMSMNKSEIVRIFASGIVIAAHFACYYLLLVENTVPDFMQHYWQSGFSPSPISLEIFLPWWGERIAGFLNFPLGLPGYFAVFGLLIALAGIVEWIRDRENNYLFWLFSFSAIMLVILSVLSIYPVVTGEYEHKSRLMLFYTPIVCLLLGAGVKFLSGRIPQISELVVAVSLFALAGPGLYKQLDNPYFRYHDMPSVYQHIADNYDATDRILVENKSIPAFAYYNRINLFEFVPGVSMKSEDWKSQIIEISDSNSRRIWVPISVGSGSRVEQYRKILSKEFGPVSVHEYKKAWLLLSEKQQ